MWGPPCLGAPVEGGEQNSKYLASWISSITYFKGTHTVQLPCKYYFILHSNKLPEKIMFLENLHFIICYFSIFTRDSNIFENEKLRKKVGVLL